MRRGYKLNCFSLYPVASIRQAPMLKLCEAGARWTEST
jgi:hypothetical protein